MIAIEYQIDGNDLSKVVVYYGLSDLTTQKIICPFHDDINPSLQLNYITGQWFCYGCAASGNAISMIKRLEHVDDLQACIKLQKIRKSEKTINVKINPQFVHNKRNDDIQSLNEAHDYYYGLKTVNWNYPEKDAQLIKQYMLNRGFTVNSLNQARAKFTYNYSYPIIFPLLDNDKFAGWVCRTNVKAVEKKRKYLYNTGFSRATTLAGNYEFKKPVMVVEGYLDMLKMQQYGIKHIVALLGWKATNEQIEKLKSQEIKNIISALDTDECGRRGTEYLSHFFNVIPYQYPDGVKDAGDLTFLQFTESNKNTNKIWRKQLWAF